jgi:uncharacterized protein (DUF2062 family)
MNNITNYISGQYKKKVSLPLAQIRKEGFSSEKLALSVSIGIIGGTFPIIGLASFVCLILTLLFKQNLVIVQVTNYMVYPLQIVLLLPLLRIGNSVLASNHIVLTLHQVVLAFQIGVLHGINELGSILLYGALAWVVVAAPALLILYIIFLVFFKRIKQIKLKRSLVISQS